MEERILDALKKLGFATQDQIIKTARLFDASERKTAKRTIEDLVADGKIVLTARHKYALPEKAGIVKGKVIASAKGFAFVRPTEGEDIYIAERDLNGAAHGDLVLVKIKSRNGGKYGKKFSTPKSENGEVLRVLERGLSRVVGVFLSRGVYDCVVPDDLRFTNEIFIAKENINGAQKNQKVVVEITRYPKRNDIAEGKIVEILGDAGEAKVDTLAVIRAFGYDDVFPSEVLAEAAKIPTKLTEKDLEGRRDYRSQLVFTIDGEDARDFDDAISLKLTPDNCYELFVHIADVANYVKPNSAIDKEAFKRGTSVYFPDHVIPMLPEALCNEMCSLKPNQDRLALTCIMKINQKGNLEDYEVCESVIHSRYRMTYTKVTAILNGDPKLKKEYAEIVPMLEKMRDLTEILIKRRDNMGQLDFDLAETQIVVNDKYETVDVRQKPREMSDRIIEQFMLMANETIAKHFNQSKIPFVYRIHENPTEEGIHRFVDFASPLLPSLPHLSGEVQPKDLQKILLEVKDTPIENMISKAMLRSMQKAIYYEKNMGHFGLACRDYCHFTSPIRRLADLTIHRIIKMYLHGQISSGKVSALESYVHEAAEQASITEQKADEVERAVDQLKMAEFMSHKIGEIYSGTISGVIEAGVFVQLDNTIEGFIPAEMLPEDRYYFEEKRVRMVGKKQTFALGQKIRVKVFSVDVPETHINFVLAPENV